MEFADARDNTRYPNSSRGGAPLVSLFGMNLSGALSDGAWKVLNHLAKLKYPTPSTHGNPVGTRSYLVAHQRWADWQMRTIMRTMVDAVAL